AGDGIAHLRSLPDNTFDVAYIDPSRRVERRKVFRLDDSVPDVVTLQQELLQRVPRVIIKSAPLLDITAALRALTHVRAVHIVSTGNECKELLFVLDRDHTDEPQLTATALTQEDTSLSFTMAEEQAAEPTFGHPEAYLYEP